MLPSLVENAIKHGLEPQREGGSVLIGAQQVGGKLRLTVADTGRGFGETIGAGVGLANIRERLAALYGDAAKLTLEENTPRGVIATIEVPSDGARVAAGAAAAGFPPPASAALEVGPRTRTAKVLGAMATAERAWRKTLSFTFMALVIVAAVFAGLGIFGVTTNLLPVHMGEELIAGPGGALIGAAGILLAFVVVVIAIAIVVAVMYGLGYVMIGLAIFVVLMMLIAFAPVLAPVILAGVAIWWILRRKDRAEKKQEQMKVEPTMAAAPAAPAAAAAASPAAGTPPPVPPADRPL